MVLIQPCDRDSIRSDKYVEHGTPIVKLVDDLTAAKLRERAKEVSNSE